METRLRCGSSKPGSVRRVFEAELGPNNLQTIRVSIDWIDTLAELGRVEEARAETELLLGMPSLPDDELASLLWTRASLAESPRPDLERILELAGVDPSTKADARARLDELATAL